MTYKDQDEKVLRDKLVNRLKEKEVLKMEHFGERLKNAKENNYFDSSDDGVEDISEEDLEQVISFNLNNPSIAKIAIGRCLKSNQ